MDLPEPEAPHSRVSVPLGTSKLMSSRQGAPREARWSPGWLPRSAPAAAPLPAAAALLAAAPSPES